MQGRGWAEGEQGSRVKPRCTGKFRGLCQYPFGPAGLGCERPLHGLWGKPYQGHLKKLLSNFGTLTGFREPPLTSESSHPRLLLQGKGGKMGWPSSK